MNHLRFVSVAIIGLAATLVVGTLVGRASPRPIAEFETGEIETEAYVASEDRAIALNRQDAGASLQSTGPYVVGQVSRSCYDLAPAGTMLYAACGNELVVFDLANPAAPIEVGSVAGANEAHTLAVSGSHVYVIDAATHLLVYDVSDPTNIAVVSDSAMAMGAPREVAIACSTLFVAEGAGWINVPSGLRVLDVTDPANPSEIALDVLSDVEAQAIALDGSTVYVGAWAQEGHGGLYVYDASVPASIDAKSSVIPDGGVTGVALGSSHAYISVNTHIEGHEKAELRIVDISDPDEPFTSGVYNFPDSVTALNDPGFSSGANAPSLYGITSMGSSVFSLESHFGIGSTDTDARRYFIVRSIDASVPSQASSRGSLVLNLANPGDIDAHGGYVYLASGESGVFVIQP